MDALVATESKTSKRAQAHLDCCRVRIEECLRITPHGTERLDRRSEVFNEALAVVIQRGEQRKERSSRVTEAAPAPKLAASTSRELRENSMEPDPNPKKTLVMKSASSAASGSGQQRGKCILGPVLGSKHQTNNC